MSFAPAHSMQIGDLSVERGRNKRAKEEAKP
jgi:hypothetical protein